MKIISRALAALVLVGAALVVTAPSATASGSDSPTPYIVDSTGITLPAGTTFPDNGHVNIRTATGSYGLHFEGKCVTRTDAECAGARHEAAQYIGRSLIPWSAFASTPLCVEWVQISLYNEHFGEGGQAPIGPGCVTPSPTPTPTATPSPTPTPTATPSPTPTPTATPSPTPTPTPTPEPTVTPTPEPTLTPEPTASPSPSVTSRPSPSSTPIAAATAPRAGDTLPATGGEIPAPIIAASVAAVLVGLGLLGYRAWLVATRRRT